MSEGLFGTIGAASFSPCGGWRYSLTRLWDEAKPHICFIMLNPSTATAEQTDATTTRCIRRVAALGYGSYEAVNLFALISKSPKALKQADDPVGPENDAFIKIAVGRASKVVVAWGSHGSLGGRDQEVLTMLNGCRLHCLGRTKHGLPRHPTYLGYAVPFVEFDTILNEEGTE